MSKVFSTLSICVAGISPAAIAHHSTNLGYDTSIRDFEITGEFIEFHWVNPHVRMRLRVTKKDGEQEIWTAETHSSTVLTRFGWRPDMFAAGQQVTVTGNPPRRAGDRFLHIQSVETADGERFSPHHRN